MITYITANWETFLSAYIIGFFAWCAFMSFQRNIVDKEYFLSAALWPAMLTHVVFLKLSLIIKGDPRRGRR